MSDEGQTIEGCIGTTEMEGEIEPPERKRLDDELRELRRKAWNWDEARRIVAQHKHQSMIAYELKTFVAGDGDAEWAQKAGRV